MSGVMLGLVSTRVETSGKLELKCGKSLDTQMLSAPPSSSTTEPTSFSPLSMAEKQLRFQYSSGDSLRYGASASLCWRRSHSMRPSRPGTHQLCDSRNATLSRG